MSENQQPQPKKKPRSRAKKLNLSVKKRWQDIVKDVEKKEVPVEVLLNVIVKLIDGTEFNVDIKHLLSKGHDPVEIEEILNEKFSQLDEYIDHVDFFIDIDRVVDVVQPETDKILKNL